MSINDDLERAQKEWRELIERNNEVVVDGKGMPKSRWGAAEIEHLHELRARIKRLQSFHEGP